MLLFFDIQNVRGQFHRIFLDAGPLSPWDLGDSFALNGAEAQEVHLSANDQGATFFPER